MRLSQPIDPINFSGPENWRYGNNVDVKNLRPHCLWVAQVCLIQIRVFFFFFEEETVIVFT